VRPKAIGFLALALAAWLVGGALDLKTTVEVTTWDGHIDWTVGATTLSARTEVIDVDSITITARPGAFPTGGSFVEILGQKNRIDRRRLPHHFSFPLSPLPPVGDWWVDEMASPKAVFSTPADLGSNFTIRAGINGRQHQWLHMELGGTHGFSCAFRRGLLNNDLVIFDHQGNVLVSGSLDPEPLERIGAATTTLLKAISGGALLLALWTIMAGMGLGRTRTRIVSLKPGVFTVILVILALCGVSLAIWTAVGIFENLPHLPDEIVYQLQARWLLSGHLTGPEPVCPEYFNIPLTYIRDGRWVGHYPPVWPLMLAPGISLNAPWLIPALLRGVHILLMGLLGLRLGGRWTGIAAAASALVSPLALLLFGSRMPHAGSATLLLAALLLCLPRNRETSAWRWIGAGFAFGAAFGMRPLTAVAVALPVGVFHLLETIAGRRRWRDSASLILAGMAAALPTLAANEIITGSPWTFPYALAEGSMYSLHHLAFGIRNLDTLLASMTPLVHGWGWPWLAGPVSQALPFAFVAALFLSRKSTREDRLLMAVAATVLLAHIGTRATGLHGFGPRYLFVPCGIVWILTARGAATLAEEENRRRPVAAIILGFLILSAAIAGPHRLELYEGYNNINADISRAAAALPPCSLVLLPADNWRGWAGASPWLGLNDDHTAPLFVTDFGETLGLEWCYPDRQFYRWEDGRMVPVLEAVH
jgi:hypothetical protein